MLRLGMEQILEIPKIGDVYKWKCNVTLDLFESEKYFEFTNASYNLQKQRIKVMLEPFLITNIRKDKKYWIYQCYYIETNLVFCFRLRSYGKNVDNVLFPKYFNNILVKLL